MINRGKTLKTTAAVAGASKLIADVRSHSWEGYDFGAGPNAAQ